MKVLKRMINYFKPMQRFWKIFVKEFILVKITKNDFQKVLRNIKLSFSTLRGIFYGILVRNVSVVQFA